MVKILKSVCLIVILTLVFSLGVMAPVFVGFQVVTANEEPPPEEPPPEEPPPEEPEPVPQEEAIPAKLLVRDLQITSVYVQPRQAVGINARVANEGGTRGSASVDLIINGQNEQSVNVGVDPGVAQPISFTVYKVTPGEYEVVIGVAPGESQAVIGDAIGTFHVMEEAAPPAPPKSGFLAGGVLDTTGIIAIVVIGIILVGGITAVFIFARRT
jgi:hypothetical protein